jgi:hypothetical protein
MRASSIAFFALIASAVPLAGACLNLDLEDDCHFTLSCPPSIDACEGTCEPAVSYTPAWAAPLLVWLGDGSSTPLCPSQAASHAPVQFAPPPDPTCDPCTCSPSTGTCALPATASASTSQCAPSAPGIASDPPSAWDGSCTAANAVTSPVESMSVGAMTVSESEGCTPQTAPATQSLPKTWTVAGACFGTTQGTCPSSGDLCLPAIPSPKTVAAPGTGIWTYCITHEGADDDYTMMCPPRFPALRVFGPSVTDTRACAACACDPPQGSACSSFVSAYSDSSCSVYLGTVEATLEGPTCVDVPGTPLGSKSASAPVYVPGACAPSGGELTGSAVIDAPMTYCCRD